MPDRRPTSAVVALRKAVRTAIGASASKLTLLELQRLVHRTAVHDRRLVQAAVRELVADGKLRYAQIHGRTVIEPSFDRPVRMSDRIVLAPPERATIGSAADVTVLLQAGAAFGDGRHPSTRLALEGIDTAHRLFVAGMDPLTETVLDIGTGSGVLVIAAVMLGFGHGLGLDIDSCARAEASANVELNGLTARIRISDQPLESLTGRFGMITANLRWPTLERQRDHMDTLLAPNGVVVLAGLRPAELERAAGWYAASGFECRWSRSLHGWAAAVLQRAAKK